MSSSEALVVGSPEVERAQLGQLVGGYPYTQNLR